MSNLTKGTSYKGFDVINTFEIKDYHSQAIHLRHRKTGLEVLHLLNDETENVFAFAFRTPNPEGNGAAHIMEHSVLCGSEKYPLKDPFTQLSNQSVKTYLNAATYCDKTVYPASSIVKADYFNLMSVYADAVFFPRLSPEIFSQEAHRLELDENGKPSIQGVVYNEMKGNYSSFESVAFDVPIRRLLKGSIYEKDSGGDPLEIPSLTYEKYLEFHRRWYRPDNCLVFLYGDIPTEEQLDFLQDNYINRLEKKFSDLNWTEDNRKALIKTQLDYAKPEKNDEPVFITATGPAGEGGEKGSTVLLTWNIGPSEDAFGAMEKLFLTGVLLNHDGSPLQKALQECGLGEDTAPGMGLDNFYTTLFTAGLRGVKKGNAEKVKEVIFDTLKKIVDEGISEEDIDSTLMTLEFSHREIRRVRGPFAISLLNAPVTAWEYGHDIEKSFRLRSVLDEIRNKIKSDKGYLEGLIKKYFLENKNYVLAEIVPSNKYGKDREIEEQKIIKKLMTTITPEKIAAENDALHAFQSSKDDVSCLPHLKPKDFIVPGKRISEKSDITVRKLETKSGQKIDYFTSEENTNGIIYLNLGFPVDALDINEYPYVPLFTDTVSDCGWGSLDWAEAARETALHTGGISVSVLTNALNVTEAGKKYAEGVNFCGRDWIVFKLRVLDEKLSEGLKLLADNINLVDFHDTKRIKDIALETRNDIDSSIIPGGHSYAITRCQRNNSRISALDELWNGISLLFNLHKQAEAKPSANAVIFRSMMEKLRGAGGFIHITAEKETIESSQKLLIDFADRINLKELKKAEDVPFEKFVQLTDIDGPVKSGETEFFEIPGQVGFASECINGTPYGTKMNAVEEVCSHWLSNILLWERIRTIGGAYGAFCDTDTLMGKLIFATYRDPTPQLSNDVFEKCLEDAASMDFEVEEVEKAVMGTFSHFIQPKTPRSRGSTSLIRTLYAITDDEREQKVLDILNTTPEEFKKGFENLSNFSKDIKYRVIIGPDKCSASGKTITLPL